MGVANTAVRAVPRPEGGQTFIAGVVVGSVCGLVLGSALGAALGGPGRRGLSALMRRLFDHDEQVQFDLLLQ
jgi:hypothetical protein